MEQHKYKVIGICGEAGSGKDTFARALLEVMQMVGIAARNVVSYTTRPKRDYEVEDIDYHYIDREALVDLIYHGKILESAEFNGWFYATGIDDLDRNKINIAVLNPEGVESISAYSEIDLVVIRCVCSDKERLIRQLNREENPDIDEIIRRYKADKNDFSNFDWQSYASSGYRYAIQTDKGFTPEEQAVSILKHLRPWAEEDN